MQTTRKLQQAATAALEKANRFDTEKQYRLAMKFFLQAETSYAKAGDYASARACQLCAEDCAAKF